MAPANRSYRRQLPKDPAWHVWGLLPGVAFAALLAVARFDVDDFDRVDDWFERAVHPLQTFGHAEFFLAVTVLGSATGIVLVAIGTAYLLRHNRFAQLQLFAVLAASSLTMNAAKIFAERARPHALAWLDPLNSYSFPSGHATLSTALYGFIAVQLYRRSRTPVARFVSIALPVLIIALVCVSRLVLNYHYATDVAGGILLGLFWLAVTLMLPRRGSRA